jgi:hypothetical protein
MVGTASGITPKSAPAPGQHGTAAEEAAPGLPVGLSRGAILFLIWVIVGASTASGTPEGCRGLTGEDLKLCEDASDVGTTIGVGLIVAFWVAADFILALTYVIYRLASRQPRG